MASQRLWFAAVGIFFLCLVLSYVGQNAFMTSGCLKADEEQQQQQQSNSGAIRTKTSNKNEKKQLFTYPRKEPMPVPTHLCKVQTHDTFLDLLEIQRFVQKYENEAYSLASKRSFIELGRDLYQHAIQTHKMLLTLQIGGMDGVSGDPMNNMLVSPVGRAAKTHKQHNVVLDLWMPLVVEPVPDNFQKLQTHYESLTISHRALACRGLRQWAVSYDKEANSTSCQFCHFNQASTNPTCTSLPEWMRNQLGTLDCAYSRDRLYGKNFDTCVLQDHLPCGTISQLLHELGLPDDAPIGILQIDVEGYEATILPTLLSEMPDENLPIIIHFEHKVLRHLDTIDQGRRAKEVNYLLRQKGYLLYDQGEDMLALRVVPDGFEMARQPRSQ